MLAENIGHIAGMLSISMLRNPVTLAVTSYLAENAPPFVFEFEQDILRYFSLAPYFFVAGTIVGFVLPFTSAKYGVLLPAAYSAWFSILLIRMSTSIEILTWVNCLNDILATFSLTPIYIIGVNLGRSVTDHQFPRWSLIDCFVAITMCCILLFAVIHRPFLAIPAALLTMFSLLAWRTLPHCTEVAEESIPSTSH